MGCKIKVKQNGTGPFKSSFIKRGEGKVVGRRIGAGEICPKGDYPKKK